jgi:diphthamide biosynthesis protein 7
MDLGSCYLGGNADAVEFCPHRPFRHVLAAATYTLQEQEQDRAGTISLFSVDAGAEEESQRLRLLHTVDTAGVFDMKWSPASPLLAQADAHGRLALRRLEQEHGSDTGYHCLSLHLSFFSITQMLCRQSWVVTRYD